jgi:hypothetical protein
LTWGGVDIGESIAFFTQAFADFLGDFGILAREKVSPGFNRDQSLRKSVSGTTPNSPVNWTSSNGVRLALVTLMVM